ncbi:hypothetical protein HDU93_006405 [Gonapodya sp. JEL0774]|nr:hypothetical protein HDU93_006405 [Gonapodya sp. JEL0774]
MARCWFIRNWIDDRYETPFIDEHIFIYLLLGADIALLRKDAADDLYLTDMHAYDFAEPVADLAQNLKLLAAIQTSNVTAFAFSRPLDAQCLDEDLTVRLLTNQWVITAYGSSQTLSYHGPNSRAGRNVRLLHPEKNIFNFVAPPDAQHFDVNISSTPFIVPMEDTIYCYSLHTLPIDGNYQIIMEEPIVSPLAHHLIVYACTDSEEQQARAMYGTRNEMQCAHISARPEDRSKNFQICQSVWSGWALGQGPLVYPSDVGKPFGSDRTLSPRSVMLEIHYDNTRRLNISDMSGMRYTYTQQTRTHNVGVLMMGTDTPGILIPPGLSSYSVPSVCPGSCTSQWKEPINVFASAFKSWCFLPLHHNKLETTIILNVSHQHMHLSGKEAYSKVVRDGVEIAELGRVRYWDNNVQSLQFVDNYTLFPGDYIETTCTYDSSKRTTPTKGGLATSDEMCLFFISYWPLMPMGFCIQEPIGNNNTLMAYCPYNGTDNAGFNAFSPYVPLPPLANAPGATCRTQGNTTTVWSVDVGEKSSGTVRQRLVRRGQEGITRGG